MEQREVNKHRGMRDIRSNEIGFILGGHLQHDIECVSLTDCLLVCRCPRQCSPQDFLKE